MDNRFIREESLIGGKALEKLKKSRVAVFGVGGVGSYALEALARAGVGNLVVVDGDAVALSNINRQLIALTSTLGKNKAEVAKARIADINPDADVTAIGSFFDADTLGLFDFESYDYVVDAIDTLTAKQLLIETAYRHNTPIISSMGTGNKLDPTMFEVAKIKDTSVCPLARIMRARLKKSGIDNLKVVYSKEQPLKAKAASGTDESLLGKRSAPASISFVPPVAGLILAGEVIKDLIESI